MGGSPIREFMPALPHWLAWGIYVALAVTAVVFVILWKRRINRSGTAGKELLRALIAALKQNPKRVIRRLVADVFGQARVRRNALGGTLHVLIFGSVAVLFVGTALVGIDNDITGPVFGWRFLAGGFYLAFETVLDTAALALIAGTLLAMWRRYKMRPAHLGGRRSVHLAYAILLYLSVSGLVLEALRMLVVPADWDGWSYAGYGLSRLLDPLVGANPVGVYQFFWAAHVVVAFAILAAIPGVMFDHLVVLPVEMILQDAREPGKLTKPFDLPAIMAEDGDLEGVAAGLTNPAGLPWERRFMLDACIDCGRCEAVCPANAAGRPLSPRVLIQTLGRDLRETIAAGAAPDDDVFTRGVVEEATAWSCLTCGACARECPALIDQPGIVVELRRRLVEVGQVPERQAGVLEAVERNQNPLGLPSYQRTEWAAGLDLPLAGSEEAPEYLYWIGCMAAYDPRVKSVAEAMVKILRHAGVSFVVLGEEERCCGEAQRKLGDEAGFQMRVMENLALFEAAGTTKVLTHCPHCLATFTKDYPDFGAGLEVVHHSQLLAELIAAGRVPASAAGDLGTVTYHDPCNLARLGGVMDQPRAVCRAVAGPQFIELGKSRDKSFCCGGGGANYFYRVPEERSVSSLRLGQATEAGATTVATACPFCTAMLEDAARSAGDGAPRIADLAELVAAGLPVQD